LCGAGRSNLSKIKTHIAIIITPIESKLRGHAIIFPCSFQCIKSRITRRIESGTEYKQEAEVFERVKITD
jgi:hypothetical protein